MSYEQMQNNQVYLSGQIASEPVFSHDIMDEKFYDFTVSVKRLSGQEDVVPVTVSDRLMRERLFEIGDYVGLAGQFRSYNKIVDNHSKLVLKVFVRELCPYDEQTPNSIEIEGFVCKPPVYRTPPFKREICDLLVAVNRAYNKSDYIPAIAWGRNARYASGFLVGDKVRIAGRIQSRIYQKQLADGTSQERVAYEVSITSLNAQIDERTDENVYE